MQDRCGESSSSSGKRRGHLPPLAPRDSRPTTTGRDSSRTSVSSPSATKSRPPRLSHRSRAGCWTCRGRKVKCDETHPRCGPCTRLNRECDWDHRWNFNDATTSTKGKYSNVNTSGNAVWDPNARGSLSLSITNWTHDDLPDFAALTSDEDRERKAGTRRPGTFAVVVTPESFHDLPEYVAQQRQCGNRRTSGGSASSASPRRGGHRSSMRPLLTPARTNPDPNIVVLERFEDVSPTSAGPFSACPFSATSSDLHSRRESLPETLRKLSITPPPYQSSVGTAPHTPVFHQQQRNEDHLVKHFRQYIIPRLVQPQQDSLPGVISQGSMRGVLEVEATRFPPLHHSICAISALNLAYTGRSSLEEAMQHYHQALAASSTASTPSDLLSDGVFFRHFLLFIYDICIPMHSDSDDGTDMWAEHLNHLRRIAMQRHTSGARIPYAFPIWSICELDMYACLMGSGNCEFLRTILSNNMLPPLEHQIPPLANSAPGTFLPEESPMMMSILYLNQGIILRTAKLAQTAQTFRTPGQTASPGARARWQATATQLQTDLNTFWSQNCPEFLLNHPATTSPLLPERIRYIFISATLLFHASMLYARTSLFPSQSLIPSYHAAQDTPSRIASILSLTSPPVNNNNTTTTLPRNTSTFALFIAGIAAPDAATKRLCIDGITAFEGRGIGQNTYRTRRLLSAVVEERREGEWVGFSRERGLGVLSCGL
ncbi:Proteasome component ECM29 [Lecanosticta acicola]|uniref:Proteasome component ECM29 n=1 Tax=Lecanosticta acicola TaxID=111012 RepID=A0AAI8YT65_9PEZI|nr:Proteasome component ECM29 [Lecanosticta acicola]